MDNHTSSSMGPKTREAYAAPLSQPPEMPLLQSPVGPYEPGRQLGAVIAAMRQQGSSPEFGFPYDAELLALAAERADEVRHTEDQASILEDCRTELDLKGPNQYRTATGNLVLLHIVVDNLRFHIMKGIDPSVAAKGFRHTAAYYDSIRREFKR